MARDTGISEGVLRKYLAGKSDPSRARLVELAKAGSVALEWLATGEGQMDASAPASAALPPIHSKEPQDEYNDSPGGAEFRGG